MAASPQLRIEAEAARRGRRELVMDCVSILRGREPDLALAVALGGPAAPRMLTGESRADLDLWTCVWAARGLLWALDASTVGFAAEPITAALNHPGWRVREKAAQVVARHRIEAALSEVVELRESDPVGRVRAAADRAVRRLTVSGG